MITAKIDLNSAVSAAVADQPNSYSTYISKFTIYSPDTSYQICVGANCTGQKPPQEFLVRAPEPPFFALLGVDLSGVGALIFLLRRRRSGRS